MKVFWHQRLGSIERLFRWINQTAYLVSVPFLMVLLLGIMVRNHHMAIVGATVVVVLNIARLVSGFANLAVIPFRDGFNLKRMKKPFRRFIEPAITIGLVGLAFALSPWLSRGGTNKGLLPGHMRPAWKASRRNSKMSKEKRRRSRASRPTRKDRSDRPVTITSDETLPEVIPETYHGDVSRCVISHQRVAR